MQPFVAAEAAIVGDFDVREARWGGARSRQVLAELVGQSLVRIGEDVEADAMVADVGDIQEQVLGEFLLNGEVPALDIAVAIVAGDVADFRDRRIEFDGEIRCLGSPARASGNRCQRRRRVSAYTLLGNWLMEELMMFGPL